MIDFLYRIYLILLDLFFPRHCPVCDRIIRKSGVKICPECKDSFIKITGKTCMKCGKELKREDKNICYDCSRNKHFFQRHFSLYHYRSVSKSIFRYKYQKRMEYAEYYADEIVKEMGELILQIQPDGLVPVPIHHSRLVQRGFNQAEKLADEIGKRLDIPVYANYVVRDKKTRPQKELSRGERQNNLKKAFKITQNDVKLSTIIIIDDIYTTGSTIDMVSRVCLSAGVNEVYGISLAIGEGV